VSIVAKYLTLVFVTLVLILSYCGESQTQSQHDEYLWIYANQILELNAITRSADILYTHHVPSNHLVLEMTYDKNRDVIYVIEAVGTDFTTLDLLYQTQLVRIDRQTGERKIISADDHLYKLILSPSGEKGALVSVTFYRLGEKSQRSQNHVCILDFETLYCDVVDDVQITTKFVWRPDNELLMRTFPESTVVKLDTDTLQIEQLVLPDGYRGLNQWASASQLDIGIVSIAKNFSEDDLDNLGMLDINETFFIFDTDTLEVKSEFHLDVVLYTDLAISSDGSYFMLQTSTDTQIYNTSSGQLMFTVSRDDYYRAQWAEYSNHVWLYGFSNNDPFHHMALLDLEDQETYLITIGESQ